MGPPRQLMFSPDPAALILLPPPPKNNGHHQSTSRLPLPDPRMPGPKMTLSVAVPVGASILGFFTSLRRMRLTVGFGETVLRCSALV